MAGRLHLNLSALGIDPDAPDFGERLCRLSRDNHPYDFEFSARGELIVMSPSGWESNIGEKGINAPLLFWTLDNGGFDVSQTVLFNLPGGARYMPDAAWITPERYDALLAQEYQSAIGRRPRFRSGSPFPHRQPRRRIGQNAGMAGRRRPPGLVS